ncbi:hypothetical protein RB213_004352 [Colletotrichum asianum]
MAPQAVKTTTKKASSSKESMADMPIFFYMPDAKWGELCQWHKATFWVAKAEISDLDGHLVDEADPHGSITFNCAEQQAQILATSSPKEQKALGKAIVGFTEEMWDPIKSAVVEAGNIAKLNQNPGLARKLLSTGDRLLCEAASRDRVWGIGYSAKHAMSQQKHWGEDRLGKALMATRQHLRNEQTRGQRRWDQWQN